MAGVTGRRYWSLEEKRAIVAESFEVGMSIAGVARRHDMNANLISTWRRDPRFNPSLAEGALPEAELVFLQGALGQATARSVVAPGLAFHEINDVGLLGPSDWLDDELLRVGRRHVAGAVISSPFHAESDLPFVVEFVEGYRNTFAAEPDMYAAEAFDATNLVLVQLSAGRDDRKGVRAGLLDTRAFPGASGVLTIHPDGNARRRPFLLRVSGRRFQPLD